MVSKVIIFGATGDLVKSKIAPALHTLGINFLSYGRKDISEENYIKGELTEIAEKLVSKDITHAYVALPPLYYEVVLSELATLENVPMIALEKPFGISYADAEKLISLIKKLKIEDKVYLVDHYLGKAELIELLDLDTETRKEFFDENNIEAIELTATEINDVDTRGTFYDSVGTIKDYVENHVMAMISIVLMQQGCEVSSTVCRQHILEKISFVEGSLRTAQYEGFRNIQGVKNNSTTETAVQIDFVYNNHFPIRVRVGKALDKAEVVIKIKYKNGDNKDVLIGSKTNPYENIFTDFLSNGRKFSLSFDEAKLCWKITEEVLKEKVGKTPSIYRKGSDILSVFKS